MEEIMEAEWTSYLLTILWNITYEIRITFIWQINFIWINKRYV